MITKQKPKKRVTKTQREAQLVFASMGGKAIFKKRGKKGMSEIGRLGAAARWKKAAKNGK